MKRLNTFFVPMDPMAWVLRSLFEAWEPIEICMLFCMDDTTQLDAGEVSLAGPSPWELWSIQVKMVKWRGFFLGAII